MRGCVARYDLWPWPMPSRSFSSDFATKQIKYGTYCRFRSTARTFLDRFLPYFSRWRHQMETVSTLLALCAGNSLITGEAELWFFYLRLNKRLSKQSWDWWFETPWRSLWRHNNGYSENRLVRPLSGSACPHRRRHRWIIINCVRQSTTGLFNLYLTRLHCVRVLRNAQTLMAITCNYDIMV